MKIELSDYFKENFRSAYLFVNNMGRNVVELVPKNKGDKKRFISYAKYLWISSNKREVPVGFEVDHIDNNPNNDTIESLQILSKGDNIRKSHEFYKHPPIKMTCPVCGKTFYREYRNRHRFIDGKTTCSRACCFAFNRDKMPNKPKPVIAINIQTGEKRYYNSTLAAQIDGFNQQNVSKCCNGKLKTYKGFIWNFT